MLPKRLPRGLPRDPNKLLSGHVSTPDTMFPERFSGDIHPDIGDTLETPICVTEIPQRRGEGGGGG
eukprot:1961535-Pyramimonas_sp.AAC.1